MLHIVLLVLKIIGILILVILGLALFLLLAGLTVPLRYGIRGSYYGKAKGSIKITWLLHIVSAVIAYDGEPSVRVKVFGIPVYRPDKKKAEKIGKEALEGLAPEIPEAKKAADSAARTVKKAGKKVEKTAEEPKRREPEHVESKPVEPEHVEPKQEPEPEAKASRKSNIFKSLPQKITGFFNKIRRLIRRIKAKLRQADTAVKELKAWIEDETNKKMIREVWRHAKALIRHGLPRRMKGKVVFGFDDPYVTGQVLSYGAMLYPFYGKQISIQPVFDRVIFECEGTIKGRIRLGTVGFRLLCAYRNKTFRGLIKKWMG